jgi:hypothetical protein
VSDRRLAAVWLCAVAVLVAVMLSHVVGDTTAYYTDSHPGSIGGSLATPTPTPGMAATVRIVPHTINLGANGDITAFIDGLPDPYLLSEIDLSSVQLCYQGACAPSDGAATLDGNAHVAANFTRPALAGLVGTDRGDLVLTVQGSLKDGSTFSGTASVTVIGDGTPDATPTATPGTTPTPTPTATPPAATACPVSLFSYGKSGASGYPMLSVRVWANATLPAGCTLTFSLNAYATHGPSWASTGTQQLFDHQTLTLDANQSSGTLTVAKPPCFGQTDFYTGTTRFDGVDGPLPHYPGTNVPQPLLAWSNGGHACTDPLVLGAPTDTPAPAATPAPTATVTPDATPTADPTATPDPTPAPTDTPAPTAAPTPAPTPAPDPGPTPTITPDPTPAA